MKSYLSVSWKYLKEKKKRTILTIIGVILSMALITGTGTIIASLHNVLIQSEFKNGGNWHIGAENINGDKVEKISNHVDIEKTAIVGELGYGKIGNVEEVNYMYAGYKYKNKLIRIKSYDSNALMMLPINLIEGRMPKEEEELVVDEWVLEEINASIGDSLEIEVGERIDKDGNIIIGGSLLWQEGEEYVANNIQSYTIVGVTEARGFTTRTYIGSGITYIDNTKLDLEQKYSVFSQVKNLRKAKEIAIVVFQDADLDSRMIINDPLLSLYAASTDIGDNEALILIFIFLSTLIIIATVAVIYNSFNISVIERMSQFGLLRCIGATPKQIQRIILREAIFIGGIGIPIGAVCGVFAMKLILIISAKIAPNMNFLKDVQVVISLPLLIVSLLLGIVTILLSVYIPAKRAGEVSAVDAVRNAGEFCDEKKGKMRKSKFLGYVFGFEGIMASKNLRRNKKRFKTTIFSMIISIVLLVAFGSYFNDTFILNSNSPHQYGDSISYDLNNSKYFTEGDIKEIREIDGIENVFRNETVYGKSLIVPADKLDNKYLQIEPQRLQKTETGEEYFELYNNDIICVGNENLKLLNNILEEGEIDIEMMNKNNGVVIIQNFQYTNRETQKLVKTNSTNYKVGDTLTLRNLEGDNESDINYTVAAILSKPFLRDVINVNNDAMCIYITEEQFQEIKDVHINHSILISVTDGSDLDSISEKLQRIADENSNLFLRDYAKAAKEEKDTITTVRVFIYGFILVITLIGCINIINTISTNLILRTKELSVYRAIGSDQKGIKKMVMIESLLYGFYAIIYGGIIGTILAYGLYKITLKTIVFPWQFPYVYLIISGVGCFIVTFLSGQIPLRRINKDVIVENLRME